MRIAELKSAKNLHLVMLCIALVQVSLYYLAGATVRSDGGFASVQPDTLLYCQAARRIVEGAPFSFSAGEAVTTGTTSILYPYVLAVPYALGFTGDSLLRAGFFLNAFFYLLFLFGWAMAFGSVFRNRPGARVLACLLTALLGPCAYAALAQSDIGLWLAASGWLAAGLASGRFALYAPLLVVGPWVRPEGMVLALAFCSVLVCGALLRRTPFASAFDSVKGRDWALAFLALGSMGGVFLLNFLLTGEAQFSSVAHKGYFKTYPIYQAMMMTCRDGAMMLRELFCGGAVGFPRAVFFLPFLSGLLFFVGIFSADWRRGLDFRRCAWLLAVLGGVGTVAMSGWQDTNCDRYLAWTFPASVAFVALGADVVMRRLNRNAVYAPAVLLIGFAAVSTLVLAASMRTHASRSDRIRAFAAQCERTIPLGTSVGTRAYCGMAYAMEPRRFAHLSGIYSRAFEGLSVPQAISLLKNDPSCRFTYWIYDSSADGCLCANEPDKVLGALELPGPDGLELRKADWRAFDVAMTAPSAPKGMKLVDKVDIGYRADERRADYETLTLYDQPEFAPIIQVRDLNGRTAVDVGRVILGEDEMTVKLTPGVDAVCILRTAASARTGFDRDVTRSEQAFSFKEPMHLHVEVDGRHVGATHFEVKSNVFNEVRLKIPGSAIVSPTSRIGFEGEHLAFGYWFYQ